jgi:hypothetical protein
MPQSETGGIYLLNDGGGIVYCLAGSFAVAKFK